MAETLVLNGRARQLRVGDIIVGGRSNGCVVESVNGDDLRVKVRLHTGAVRRWAPGDVVSYLRCEPPAEVVRG